MAVEDQAGIIEAEDVVAGAIEEEDDVDDFPLLRELVECVHYDIPGIEPTMAVVKATEVAGNLCRVDEGEPGGGQFVACDGGGGGGGGGGVATLDREPHGSSRAPHFKPSQADEADDWLRATFKSQGDTASETEKKAVDDYAKWGFKEINKSLRSGNASDRRVKVIDQIIERNSLPMPMTVYRQSTLDAIGHQQTDLSKINPEAIVGKIIEDKGFLSTSLAERPSVSGARRSYFRISVPKGTKCVVPAAMTSVHGGESEIVFGRGSRIRVTGYNRQASEPRRGYYVFDAEFVGYTKSAVWMFVKSADEDVDIEEDLGDDKFTWRSGDITIIDPDEDGKNTTHDKEPERGTSKATEVAGNLCRVDEGEPGGGQFVACDSSGGGDSGPSKEKPATSLSGRGKNDPEALGRARETLGRAIRWASLDKDEQKNLISDLSSIRVSDLRALRSEFGLKATREGKAKTIEALARAAGVSHEDLFPVFARDSKIPGLKEAAVQHSSLPDVERSMKRLGVQTFAYDADHPNALDVANRSYAVLSAMKKLGYPVPDIVTIERWDEGERGNFGITTKGEKLIAINPDSPKYQTWNELTGWHASTDPFSDITHEFGHFLHNETGRMGSSKMSALEMGEVWLGVSRYAATGAVEMVAEVFSGVMAGKKYSDRIMGIYRKHGGPEIRMEKPKRARKHLDRDEQMPLFIPKVTEVSGNLCRVDEGEPGGGQFVACDGGGGGETSSADEQKTGGLPAWEPKVYVDREADKMVRHLKEIVDGGGKLTDLDRDRLIGKLSWLKITALRGLRDRYGLKSKGRSKRDIIDSIAVSIQGRDPETKPVVSKVDWRKETGLQEYANVPPAKNIGVAKERLLATGIEKAEFSRSEAADRAVAFFETMKARGLPMPKVILDKVPSGWRRSWNGAIGMYEALSKTIVVRGDAQADTCRKKSEKDGWMAVGNSLGTLAHEYTHFLHQQSLGENIYRQLRLGRVVPGVGIEAHRLLSEFRRNRAIAAKVSRYAETKPTEFVAEVGSGILTGKKYDKDVIDLYHKLGGWSFTT